MLKLVENVKQQLIKSDGYKEDNADKMARAIVFRCGINMLQEKYFKTHCTLDKVWEALKVDLGLAAWVLSPFVESFRGLTLDDIINNSYYVNDHTINTNYNDVIFLLDDYNNLELPEYDSDKNMYYIMLYEDGDIRCVKGFYNSSCDELQNLEFMVLSSDSVTKELQVSLGVC